MKNLRFGRSLAILCEMRSAALWACIVALASAWRFFCFTASLDGALFLPRGLRMTVYELTSTFIADCARWWALTLTGFFSDI